MTASARSARRRRRGRPPEPVEVWTAALEDEPPVRAWRALDAGPLPVRLELLRRRKMSVVYRLPGVGRDGSDVIAKQGLWQIAHDERAAYAALERLDLPRLAYYGFHAEPVREVGWLFVEDAHGEPWLPDEPLHRQLSTRWLATLHARSAALDAPYPLPDRGLAWFREHLDEALPRIRGGFENPAVAEEAHPLLDGMLRLLDTVNARWPEIGAACAEMPRVLVHGDFAERNVRIRHDVSGPRVLIFDWEVSGLGLPAVDLVDVDVDDYVALVREAWPRLDAARVTRFIHLGQLLRGGVAATRWAAESLSTHWTQDALRELPHYAARILRAFDALGWRGVA